MFDFLIQLNRDFNSNKTVKNSLPNAHFLAFAWDNARPDGKFYVTVDQTIFPIALKDDLSVKVMTSGSVFALPDGRYYCAATVSNMPNSSYGYVEVATWGDEKMIKVYDLKANANMYLNTYAKGTWAGWTVK